MKTRLLASVSVLALGASAQEPPRPDAQPPAPKRGLVTTSERAAPGYTLIAPLRASSTFLVDLAGNTVHEWKSDAPTGQSVYLLDNGHLLRCERLDNPVFSGGGQGGRVREFDWDGNLVWEYVCSDETRLHHHDLAPMPNGNVLLIAWEAKSKDEALAAGRDPELMGSGQLWPDMVLEIEPVRPSGGKVVWEWHAFDHLIQDFDEELAGFGDVAAHPERIDINADRKPARPKDEEDRELAKLRKLGYVGDAPPARDAGIDGGPPRGMRGGDWLHTNSIDYHAELDLILLGSRELSEIWVIDHSTTTAEARTSEGGKRGRGGDLLFRWGNAKNHRAGAADDQRLFVQHNAQWIRAGLPGAGNILVFNNGHRPSSSVDELAISFDDEVLRGKAGPKVELVWTYSSPDIESSHISGAQRLANGNTLVCNGEKGRVVEVTREGEVVWDWLSTLEGKLPMGGPPRGAPPGGERGAPGFGPPGRGRGPGGPGDAHGLFRAPRYAPDHPGLAKLASKG